MRIIIDLQGYQSESRFRGIGRYSIGLVKALLKVHSDHEIILLLNGAFRETIESIRGIFEHDISQDCIKVFEIPSPVSENNPENDWRARSAEILREWVIESLSPDWVLVTSLFEGWGDDACVALTERKRKFRTAIVLYDLIPLALPDQSFVGPRHRYWYENKLKSLLRSDLLLAISNFTRQDAISRLAIGPESIKTINAGVDERFQPKILSRKEKDLLMEKFSFGNPFLLFVPGGFEWKKNFDALLHAFSLLPENLRNHYRIVIPGKHPSEIRERLLNLSGRLGIVDRVHFPGYVSDDDLIGLYRTTSLFVFPSLYEGVGLPLLEAMACGVPVIGSKTTSIPEVIGFEKGLFDPENPKEIAKTIETFLTDLQLREVAVAYGLNQVQKFSWNRVAVKTLEALEEYRPSKKKTNKNILISDFGLFKRSSKRILVMKLDHRGDLILAVPAIRKLRAKYPDAHIDLLVGPWNLEIAETLYLGNKVFSVNFFQDQSSDAPITHRKEFQKLVKSLGQYDIAIDFRRQRDTRFLLFEIDAKQRVGYRTHDESIDSRLDVLLDSELDRSGEMISHNRRSIALQMLDIVEALDRDDSDFLLMPEISGGNKKEFGVAVFPFAGNPIREWGLSNFEYVILQLNKDPSIDVIHIYTSEKERAQISKAIRQCQKIFIHEGLSFRSLMASLKENSVALANNSFGAHVSALAGLKVVGIYGGQEKADEWAPVFGKGHSIFQVDLPCSPCHLPSPHDCNHGLECLTLISPDLVLERILELTKSINSWRKGEEFYQNHTDYGSSRYSYEDFLLIKSDKDPSDRDLKTLARSITLNHVRRSHELFFDISELVKVDSKSGIQRVVRSILGEWLQNPPRQFNVQPIYLTDEGGEWHYRYARKFSLSEGWTVGDRLKSDFPVDPMSGDVFFAPDLAVFLVTQATRAGVYDVWKSRGVNLFFLVHDLLPILHPDWFSVGTADLFQDWLKSISRVSTGLICYSKSTEKDLKSWLANHPPVRSRDLMFSTVPLGGDFLRGQEKITEPKSIDLNIAFPDSGTTFLMVGTLEPRKGHNQVLQGFDLLWKAGKNVNLVIVGKMGWKVDQLAKEIQIHSEFGGRLFWFKDINDVELDLIYRKSDALIMASLNEGYGLPLVEAVLRKVPIIARDIPVFREILCNRAIFFSGENPEVISASIARWMDLRNSGSLPEIGEIPVTTWRECAEEILSVILPAGIQEKSIKKKRLNL